MNINAAFALRRATQDSCYALSFSAGPITSADWNKSQKLSITFRECTLKGILIEDQEYLQAYKSNINVFRAKYEMSAI